MLLSWECNDPPRPKPFLFEWFCMEHSDFLQNIKTWWQDRSNLGRTKMYRFQQKLKHVKHMIKIWNKEVFGNIFEAKLLFEKEMEML